MAVANSASEEESGVSEAKEVVSKLVNEGEACLEGAPDPSFGGMLMGVRKGALIEYSDDESDAESEYEWPVVPATRADLLGASSDGTTVQLRASFRVQKTNRVNVHCR